MKRILRPFVFGTLVVVGTGLIGNVIPEIADLGITTVGVVLSAGISAFIVEEWIIEKIGLKK